MSPEIASGAALSAASADSLPSLADVEEPHAVNIPTHITPVNKTANFHFLFSPQYY